MNRSLGVVVGALSLAVVFPAACDHPGLSNGPAGSGGSSFADSGAQGGAAGANDDAGTADVPGAGDADGPADRGPDGDGSSTEAGAGALGFSCTLDCGGEVPVYLGVRPPQTAGSDVISWNVVTSSGAPTGDQLWTYDAANRLLVNSINDLALKIRPDHSLTLGVSATDGSAVTLRSNTDSTYGLVFDDGDVVGIAAANCPGAPFSSVAPGTAGYRTAYVRH